MTVSQTLVDTGILVALYDSGDRYHSQVIEFLSNYRGRLVTTLGCVTEVMWLLAPDHQVQNEFCTICRIRFMTVNPFSLKTLFGLLS
jgi:predicted nucleic acid-binding protein